MSPIFKKKRLSQMDKDIFGFADAIEIELINEDNLKIVELIFKDFK